MMLNKIRKLSFRELVKKIDLWISFGRLECLLSINWFNPFATLYVNLRCLPFTKAVKLPVYIYGRPRIYCLVCDIEIEGNVYSGMLRFNQTLPGAPSLSIAQSELNLFGKLIISGRSRVGTGTKLYISGQMSMGHDVKIMDMCNICCTDKIILNDYVRITHRCQILDSNYHFTVNCANRSVKCEHAPIQIGNACWVGNSTTITGGSVLPKSTIVGSNSLINKDFSSAGEFCLIGGIPAKVIKQGFCRINNLSIENEVRQFFKENPNDIYIFDENCDIEKLITNE